VNYGGLYNEDEESVALYVKQRVSCDITKQKVVEVIVTGRCAWSFKSMHTDYEAGNLFTR